MTEVASSLCPNTGQPCPVLPALEQLKLGADAIKVNADRNLYEAYNGSREWGASGEQELRDEVEQANTVFVAVDGLVTAVSEASKNAHCYGVCAAGIALTKVIQSPVAIV